MNLFQVIGNVGVPKHIEEGYGVIGGDNAGLLGFISNIVKFIIVVGGIWAFFNLILAGFTYITVGDKPDELKKANDRMTYSLIGLVILVGSVVIAGIIGFFLYGDPRAILQPKIYGPGV